MTAKVAHALRAAGRDGRNTAIVMTQAAECTWRGLPPERDEAPQSTVEALMYELRTNGLPQLRKENTQRRLADLSVSQLREVIEQLIRLQPKYPRIDDELIETLRELSK
jgi:hypothetical protein